MRKPVGFTAKEETSALFVRVPARQAEVLDRVAFELKRPKRAIVSALLATLETNPARPVLGHAGFDAPAAGDDDREVLDLNQLAAYLGVDVTVIRKLADDGELPGRQLGGEWRFARGAVLDWLARG